MFPSQPQKNVHMRKAAQQRGGPPMSTLTLPETTGAIAAQFKHPNQRYRRSREEAARIIAEAINGPYSPETLRKSPTPYMTILGRAQYADDDLFDRAEA